MVGRNNPGLLVCSTQTDTGSLSVIALVQKRGKHHMSYAQHELGTKTRREGWISQWSACPRASLHACSLGSFL